MWHCVITVCRGSQRVTVKYTCVVDQIDGLNWRLCGRKVRKRRGVLGLARVPKDLEEAKGLGRREKGRRVIERGQTPQGASLQAITERCTHTDYCNVPVTVTVG